MLRKPASQAKPSHSGVCCCISSSMPSKVPAIMNGKKQKDNPDGGARAEAEAYLSTRASRQYPSHPTCTSSPQKVDPQDGLKEPGMI
jgi:hypothetical protein